MGRLKSLALALVVACLAMTTAPAPARAESLLWTIVASPLTATTGTETTFTLTVTNEDVLEPIDSGREIGCVIVHVPTNFAVAAATVTGSNAGGSWAASLSGNRVRVQAGSGGDRLDLLQWVRFTVRATPLAAGSLAWSTRAVRNQGCGGAGTAAALPPIVVVSGQPVTPTPLPLPSVLPTVRPTPLPTLLPSVLPTLLPTDRPTASPTLRSSGTPTPTASSSAGGDGPSTLAGSDGAPPGHSGTEPPPEPGLRIDADMLFGFGTFEWVVPAAVVGVPGLLVIVAWVAAQTGAALIWIPAVRRFREERRRRRWPVLTPSA